MIAKKKFGLRITQVSLNQTAWDFPRNLANIYAAIDEAVKNGSDLLALEELTYNGYESNDEFQKTDNARTFAHLSDIADYAAALDPNLIISVGHTWRMLKRDVRAVPGAEGERLKSPLFNRLDKPYNVQTIINGGQVQAMTAKMHLYNDERGYEQRYFQEWSMQAANEYGGKFGTLDIELPDGRTIPFGRPIVHVFDKVRNLFLNLAHIICEEKWVATQWGGAPHNDSQYDADGVAPQIMRYVGTKDGLLALVPNASPPTPLKMDKHTHLAKKIAEYFNAVVDTDGLGTSGSTFAQFGHSLVVVGKKVVSVGARMVFNRVAANTTTIKLNSAPEDTATKAHIAILHDFKNADAKTDGHIAYKDDPAHYWDDPAYDGRDKEEVTRMTALWLFDYMRKAKVQGIAEALSGGADSAFNSVIVKAMVQIGMNELGVDGFCREMKHLKFNDKILSANATGGVDAAVAECMKHMLTTVYMGTDNSSEDTRKAAEFLANDLGGKHMERNIQDLVNSYALAFAVENVSKIEPVRKAEMLQAVAAYLNQKQVDYTDAAHKKQHLAELDQQQSELRRAFPELTGRLVSSADPREAVAYENIQARAREVLIMLIANAEGKMAIANPNLDEARNAYATFGGDLHSGTVNLNAFIPKAYQLQVMQYLYDTGLKGVVSPVRGLELVLKNKPSAELLPKDASGKVVQSDEDSLQRSFAQMNRISRTMLYNQVDTVDGRRLMNATEVFLTCQKSDLFDGVSPNILFNMIRLSYARWNMSQHKIHASPIAPTMGESVDHQSSRRTPNLSGQSFDEIATLGVKLMAEWAREDGVVLSGQDFTLIEKRAGQDENFVNAFDNFIWVGRKNQTYDLHAFYEKVKASGWDVFFAPLPANDPIMVVHKFREGVPACH